MRSRLVEPKRRDYDSGLEYREDMEHYEAEMFLREEMALEDYYESKQHI